MPCLLTHVFPVSPSRRYSSWGQGFRLSHVPPSAPGIGRALNKPMLLMNTAASHDKCNERNTADAMENYSRKTSFRWGMQGRPPWGPGIYVDGYAGIDRKIEEEGVVQSEATTRMWPEEERGVLSSVNWLTDEDVCSPGSEGGNSGVSEVWRS